MKLNKCGLAPFKAEHLFRLPCSIRTEFSMSAAKPSRAPQAYQLKPPSLPHSIPLKPSRAPPAYQSHRTCLIQYRSQCHDRSSLSSSASLSAKATELASFNTGQALSSSAIWTSAPRVVRQKRFSSESSWNIMTASL